MDLGTIEAKSVCKSTSVPVFLGPVRDGATGYITVLLQLLTKSLPVDQVFPRVI